MLTNVLVKFQGVGVREIMARRANAPFPAPLFPNALLMSVQYSVCDNSHTYIGHSHSTRVAVSCDVCNHKHIPHPIYTYLW